MDQSSAGNVSGGRRRRKRAQIPSDILRDLGNSDLSLDGIAQEIAKLTGEPAPSRSAVSKWLKKLDLSRHISHDDLIPWEEVRPEHETSRWHDMLQSVGRIRDLEDDEEPSDTDQRYYDMFFDYADPGFGRRRMVAGYHEDIGWYLTDATDEEIAAGEIIRRPKGNGDDCAQVG